MRIAMMGSGGIGGYLGARLAQAGEDVTFIARGSHFVKLHPTMTPRENALIDCFRKTISQLKGVTVGRET